MKAFVLILLLLNFFAVWLTIVFVAKLAQNPRYVDKFENAPKVIDLPEEYMVAPEKLKVEINGDTLKITY